MTPNLTPDQKQHIRMAHRAKLRIEETWSLFCMHLSQGKKPVDALVEAREAVDVWADWMDDNDMEFPDIDRPDIGQQMERAAEMMVNKFKEAGMPTSPIPCASFLVKDGEIVDAEFAPERTPDSDLDRLHAGIRRKDSE